MKRVTFLLDEKTFKKAKIKTITNDKNMTDYITELIEKDLGKDAKKEQSL